MASIKEFFKDAFIYSVAGWISRLLGFILLPVYTRIFSPDDYGVFDLIAASTAFLIFGLQLGLDSAVTRFFSASNSETEKRAYFSTVFWTKIFTYIPIITIFILLSPAINKLLFGDNNQQALIIWALISVFTTSLWLYFLQLYRLQFKSFIYSVFSVIYLIASIILTIYFVVLARTGIIGIYWAKVIIDSIMVCYILLKNRSFILKLEFPLLKSLLCFGLPLVPSALAYFIMEYMDRYFIQVYWGLASLGIYAVAYKISNVLRLVALGFNTAWAPFLYSIYDKKDGSKKIRLVFKGYALILVLIAFCISLFSKELLLLFTTQAYAEAYKVIYIILFSLVVYLTSDYFCVGIGIKNKTYHRLGAGIVAAASNFFLNWILIPRFGIAGAAWATFFSYLIYGGYVMFASQRLYPVNYGMKRFFLLLLIFMSCASLTLWITGSSLYILMLKIGMLLVVGILAPLLIGFIRYSDIVSVYLQVRKLFMSYSRA